MEKSRQTRPVSIGEIMDGVEVTMAASRKSRMEFVKAEFGNGDHIALSVLDPDNKSLKWTDRPDVSGEHLTAYFRDTMREDPQMIEWAIWELFPEYKSIPLSRFGFQTASNDSVSAARDDIHAHVILALDTTWYSGGIPRFTDPVAPVPADLREPRMK